MDSEMEVIWSAKARISFFMVLDYLNDNWTQKEIIQFNQKTQIVLNAIKKNSEIFPESIKNKGLRKAIVDKNNLFFYKIDAYNQRIFLLTFFDSRQNPKKLII